MLDAATTYIIDVIDKLDRDITRDRTGSVYRMPEYEEAQQYGYNGRIKATISK
jgi:hypothetical protein